MKSTFFRTFMSMAALLLASFIILGSSFATLAYRFIIEERQEALESNAEAVAATVSQSAVYSGNIIWTKQIKILLQFTSEFSGYHIIIASPNGNVIVTSDSDSTSAERWVGQDVMQTIILDGGYSDTGTLGGLYAQNYFSVGKPIVSNAGQFVGAVFVSTSVQSLRYMLTGFIRLFLFAATAVLLAACALAYMSAQRMSNPLKLTAAAAQELARGNLAVRVPVDVDEKELRELAVSFNNMASELEKTEERRKEFIANISHELKTPMTSIGGYIDGMLDGVIPPEKQANYLLVVSSEVKRLSRLVTQMLEISRMEAEGALHCETFDLCEVARLVIAGQERRISEKRLDVEMNFDEAIEVYAEKDSIMRVIYNLLDNAVKYSYEDTVITISIDRLLSKAQLSISDEGKPISPTERERIFERFHKTDGSRRSEGLGLGLYLVRNIIGRHNEDVWCDSDGGKTTMSFTLPLAPQSGRPKKPERDTIPEEPQD